MADKTQINYELLQAHVKKFQAEADAVNQVLTQTKSRVEQLHGNGWIGQGADKFFDEMENLVMPSMARLVQSLHESANAANNVMAIYKAAELASQGKIKSFNV